jgi:outer membrane protein assembly factor BamB
VPSYDGTLYALDTYGDTLWTAYTGAQIGCAAAISDGVVYVASFGGGFFVYALNAGTNAVRKPSAPPSLKSLHPDLGLPTTE